MSKLLPYPGRYESFSSWDSRCKAWERDQQRYRADMASRIKNYGGYNYHAVKHGPTAYTLPGGQIITALWVGRGSSHCDGALAFSGRTPGTEVVRVVWPGNCYTGRTDYLVVSHTTVTPGCATVKPVAWQADRATSLASEVYNNDDH